MNPVKTCPVTGTAEPSQNGGKTGKQLQINDRINPLSSTPDQEFKATDGKTEKIIRLNQENFVPINRI